MCRDERFKGDRSRTIEIKAQSKSSSPHWSQATAKIQGNLQCCETRPGMGAGKEGVSDPDVAALVAAWPSLAAPIRPAMLALI
jgi:hypothetical protein